MDSAAALEQLISAAEKRCSYTTDARCIVLTPASLLEPMSSLLTSPSLFGRFTTLTLNLLVYSTVAEGHVSGSAAWHDAMKHCSAIHSISDSDQMSSRAQTGMLEFMNTVLPTTQQLLCLGSLRCPIVQLDRLESLPCRELLIVGFSRSEQLNMEDSVIRIAPKHAATADEMSFTTLLHRSMATSKTIAVARHDDEDTFFLLSPDDHVCTLLCLSVL